VVERVVRDGNNLTGGGVTAGADFALALIAELRGPDATQAVQRALEYAPSASVHAGSPNTAPAHIRDAVTGQMESILGDCRKRVARVADRVSQGTECLRLPR